MNWCGDRTIKLRYLYFSTHFNQSDHFLCHCNIPCPLSWYVLELKDRFATFMLLLLLLLLLLLSSLLLLLILLMMLTMVFKETSVNVIKLDIEKHFSPNPRSSPFKVSFCNIFIIYFYAVPLKFRDSIKIISSQTTSNYLDIQNTQSPKSYQYIQLVLYELVAYLCLQTKLVLNDAAWWNSS